MRLGKKLLVARAGTAKQHRCGLWAISVKPDPYLLARQPEAPLPDEIAIIFCVANRGRIDARVGGLRFEDVKGEDGLL